MIIKEILQRMSIVEGDITRLDVAIHAAADPKLLEECRGLGGCPTGEARITKGYGLSAGYVIHTVGPVWQGGGQDEKALLAGCYRASLSLALENSLPSIAFPAISTGVYRFPPALAAGIAVATVAEVLARDRVLETVIFCCFGEDSTKAHQMALEGLK